MVQVFPFELQTVAQEAEELVRRLNITRLPVDPFAIANQYSIDVQSKPMTTSGISGCLLKSGDNFGILYATHINNEGFVRFTVGHELGHYFLPGHPMQLFPDVDGIHFSCNGFTSSHKYELEADHFAASLLMPESLFRRALNKTTPGFQAIAALADLCNTSITATAIRYATFSEDPVAVIVSSGDVIEYCFMSESLSAIRGISWIRKGDRVPHNTLTSDFNKNPSKILEAQSCEAWTSLDEWFDGTPDIEMKEDVIGLGTYKKTLTVVFTDEAIEPEGEDEY